MNKSDLVAAARAGRIAPFQVMALLARAQALEAQGEDVIHLEVGEPDFACPGPVRESALRAIADQKTRYTPAGGLACLREAIADYYQTAFGVSVSPGNILVTPGASGALQLVVALLTDPGEGLLVTDPGYPCNRHFLELVGGVPQPLALDAANGFRVTPAQVQEAWQSDTRGVLLASPDNPTGNVLREDELRAIANMVAQQQGALVMDEIYQGLVYESPATTVLGVCPDALVINSFSKFFCMTGWRLGWLVAPSSLVPALERMAQNFYLAPSTPGQYAAMAAFSSETLAILAAHRETLDQRRRFLLEGLARMGLPVVGKPEGAFYLYVDVSSCTDDSFAFCTHLLEREFLAITPGLDFGSGHHPERYLRMAYTCDLPRLEEALCRLTRFLSR